MTTLNEGLRLGDLNGLVVPEISIDEYNSKIDEDAIVVGFYVDDSEPAQDLSNFIEKGSGNILDTEVSPAPNEEGNYMVFVEFLRNEKFPDNLAYVLDSMTGLTGIDIDQWEFTCYGHGEQKFNFNVREVEEKVRLEPEPEDELSDAQLESLNFLKNSLLDDVRINGKNIKLQKRSSTKIFEHIATGDAEMLNHLLRLSVKPIKMDQTSLRECNVIRKMLGDNWDVNKIDEHFILANNQDGRIMVIK